MTELGQTINIRGVEHYYQWVCQSTTNHSKPVMVFIHGWGGSCRYWLSVAQSLSPYFDCLLYDMRGFGRSLLPNQPLELSYELEEYAHDLALLLEALNISQVYINAHSMGASVGAFFINLYPQQVTKAILNCNGIFEYDEKAFKAFYKFGGYVVKFRYPWFLKVPLADRFFMARFLHRPIDSELRRAFLEDFILANEQAALETIFTSVSKEAVEYMPQQFAKLSVPTLLISGEKDQITPAILGRKAAELNDKIQYAEMVATGHFPMLEDKAKYLEIIQRFLDINDN